MSSVSPKQDGLANRVEPDHQSVEKDLGGGDGSSDTTEVKKTQEKIERMRRFLAFRLAVDYDVPLQARDEIRFTRADLHYCLALALHCFLPKSTTPPLVDQNCLDYLAPSDTIVRRLESCESKGIKRPRPLDIEICDPIIDRNIKEPAKALGIPSSVVIMMLRLLMRSIYFVGYRSTISALVRDTTLSNLAAKFIIDRDVLSEVVLPPTSTELRKLLATQMAQKRAYYFKILRGPLDYEAAATYSARSQISRENWQRENGCEGSKGIRLDRDRGRAIRMFKCLSPPSKEDSWWIKFHRHFTKPKAKSWLYFDERPKTEKKER